MSKSKTPSFVCEIPLRVTRRQEWTVEARFEAERQLYNALLREAKKRLKLIRQSVWYSNWLIARLRPYKRWHGKARKVRYKGKRSLHSLEGKTNAACIRWRQEWRSRRTLLLCKVD